MDILFLLLSTILFILGMLGIFLPALPGPILIFGGILLYAWRTGFEAISSGYMVLFAVLAALSWGLDYIASLLTAKKVGASKYGLLGGILFGILGLIFFSLPGLVLGQLLGVILGELYKGKKFGFALKSGVAVFIGYLLGNGAKLILCSIMIVIFYWRVLTF